MSLFYSALFLILILLLGILLAPFLGGNKEGMETIQKNTTTSQDTKSSQDTKTLPNTDTSLQNTNSSSYDNYNHFTGSSKPTLSSSIFYGKDGSTLAVNMNGTNTLTTLDMNGKSIIYAGLPSIDGTVDSFMGPNGSVAVVVDIHGKEIIVIKDSAGNETVYTSTPANTNQNNVLPSVTPSSTPTSLIGSSTSNTTSNQATNSTSSTASSMGNTSNMGNSMGNNMATNTRASNPNPNILQSGITDPNSNYNYSSSLPPGIPASQIPHGQEDLYILKTEVVPPVCPVCPVQTTQKKCAPCPACARCPEPSYDCKLVPNYSSMNANAPIPVLNDFSTFGM